ncbi:MAG: hypothetical protein E7443_02820 [Ruminococcaceae bacterium]|nr:hypothetical protein [Oscillospiraceae bacterium]
MEIYGIFTEKGLELAAKLSAGAALTVTRVLAGSGTTHAKAAALNQIQQTLAVNTPSRNGNTAVIPATLVAANAAGNYTLTELGVYAQDPDEGEILYKIYRLTEAMHITAGSSAVLRFYLEETVLEDAEATVTCSPAGLLTEGALAPIRARVELAGAVPQNTYHLDAGDLQAFLDAQPRFLQESIIINATGTLTTPLRIQGFHGPGIIRITADHSGGCVIQNKISLIDCSAYVQLLNLQINAPAGLPSNSGLIQIENCRGVRLNGCALTGHNQEAGVRAVNALHFSSVMLENCSVKQFSTVVFAGLMSLVTVTCTQAENFSGNGVGAFVWNGGIVLLADSTPSTLGGSSNVKSGGLIVAANGSLL